MLRPGSRLKVWSLTSTLLCHDNELFPVFFKEGKPRTPLRERLPKCVWKTTFALCPPHKLCKKTSVARRSPWQNLARSMQRCFAASLKAVLNAKGVDGGANGSTYTIGLSWFVMDDAWWCMTIVLCKHASAAFAEGGLASYICPSMVAVSFAGFGCQDARRIGTKVKFGWVSADSILNMSLHAGRIWKERLTRSG